MKLQNKVAVVTGGATGIGKAIALEFAKEGADVCVCTRKNLSDLERTVDEIQRLNRNSIGLQIDVAKLADIDRMVESALERFSHIDILVNNAGLAIAASILDLTEEQWDISLDVMLKGPFFCTQRVLPHMLKQGGGKIINIASTFGQVGFYDRAAYCAAKGGLINLTRQMALELAPSNININAIGPGSVDTKISPKGKPEKIPFMDRVPAGRKARPEEIAWLALYLASNESDYVNGSTYFIDGGYLAV